MLIFNRFQIHFRQPWGWQAYRVEVADPSQGAWAQSTQQHIQELCGQSRIPAPLRVRRLGLRVAPPIGINPPGLVQAPDLDVSEESFGRHDGFRALGDVLDDALAGSKNSALPIRLRLGLAVMLASAVAQLYNTEWLERLNNRVIEFPFRKSRDAEGGSYIAVHQPHIRYRRSQTSGTRPMVLRTGQHERLGDAGRVGAERSSLAPRSDTMLQLGYLLIELFTGETTHRARQRRYHCLRDDEFASHLNVMFNRLPAPYYRAAELCRGLENEDDGVVMETLGHISMCLESLC